MTFSLAGRCARTGMVGAVVTTSGIAVGSRCAHAAAGVGAVLTQHRTDPRLGPRGLRLLRDGCDAEAALAALVASTPDADWRQVAVLDRHGRGAVFHGAHVISVHAGSIGPDCVAAGNILRDATVPQAMVAAFTAAAELDLPSRLLAAIEAGDAAGGEIRPLRSAALLVAHRESFPFVDLRVDAAHDPLAALRALWAEYAPDADAYVTRAVDPAKEGPIVTPPASPR